MPPAQAPPPFDRGSGGVREGDGAAGRRFSVRPAEAGRSGRRAALPWPRPIVVAAPDSPQAQAFRQVAGNVAARISVLAHQASEAAKKPQGVPIKFFGR